MLAVGSIRCQRRRIDSRHVASGHRRGDEPLALGRQAGGIGHRAVRRGRRRVGRHLAAVHRERHLRVLGGHEEVVSRPPVGVSRPSTG